ncbi:MAG: OmpA family protein [Bacteroidota bacterium]
MKRKIFLHLFIFLQSTVLFSQNKSVPQPAVKTPVSTLNKPISADCKKAIPIALNNNFTYGLTVAPNGFGEVQEIKTRNVLLFEEEHNSAWYLLTIAKDGELVFEIAPKDTSNDYDFLLYSYTDSAFCEDFQKNKLKPLRSNLSNIKKSREGYTGLKHSTQNNSIGKGIGNSYSKSIAVKKGEKYMLVLDNVTPEGKGHIIFFNFLKEVEIKGRILNSDSVPVVAEITLSDNKGNTIEETKSDKNGDYSIKTSVKENINYNLTVLSDSTFVQNKIINTKYLNGKPTFDNIKVVLPKLKKGEKYKLGNINFYGGVATLLPESYPSVVALYKLMKKNKKMVIQIEGHVNGAGGMGPASNQKLSDDRAKTIYNFLLLNGIAKEKMSTVGLSDRQMLFPNPASEAQASANRRVEIRVVSIK